MKRLKRPTSVILQGNVRSSVLKRQKTQKLEKLKRNLLKLLKEYDLYKGVPCQRERPEDSENVVVFGIWRF